MHLTDKVVLVAGATSGIGRAVAADLARAGASVVASGRRAQRLRELAADLEPEPGAVATVAADLCDPATPERLIAAAVDRFGRCDVVVNSAGSMHAGTIDALDLDAACAMIRANFEAAARLSYVALRHFRARGTGRLINISSVLGTKVRPTAGAYAATKHAIDALSEALRMEVAGSDIGVSVIQPGLTATELHDGFAQHPRDVLGITQPLDPEDVARCVRFVLEQPAHVRIPVLMVLPREQAM
jgi:NADP-dependent 3-hydroxy acid dehydrogenase YdfG